MQNKTVSAVEFRSLIFTLMAFYKDATSIASLLRVTTRYQIKRGAVFVIVQKNGNLQHYIACSSTCKSGTSNVVYALTQKPRAKELSLQPDSLILPELHKIFLLSVTISDWALKKLISEAILKYPDRIRSDPFMNSSGSPFK